MWILWDRKCEYWFFHITHAKNSSNHSSSTRDLTRFFGICDVEKAILTFPPHSILSMFFFKYKCTLEKQINFQIFPVCPLFYLVFISRFGLTKAIIDSFMLISFIVLTQQCTEMYFFANKTMKKHLQISTYSRKDF